LAVFTFTFIIEKKKKDDEYENKMIKIFIRAGPISVDNMNRMLESKCNKFNTTIEN
jgi:hypothetical protein